MPATAARIGFISQEFRTSVAETTAIEARYGALARTSEDPVESFFDHQADAQAMADERQALLGTERRRFRVTIGGLDDIAGLSYVDGVPVVQYVDPERGVDTKMIVADITRDYGRDGAVLTLWG